MSVTEVEDGDSGGACGRLLTSVLDPNGWFVRILAGFRKRVEG